MRFRLSIWQRAVDFAYDQACWIAVVIDANHKITHRRYSTPFASGEPPNKFCSIHNRYCRTKLYDLQDLPN